jgi:hypothetical protein
MKLDTYEKSLAFLDLMFLGMMVEIRERAALDARDIEASLRLLDCETERLLKSLEEGL